MPKAKSQRKPPGKGAKADRINKIVRRAGKKRGYTPFWLREMGEADLDFLESYTAHYELIGARSVHIPLKYKELITLPYRFPYCSAGRPRDRQWPPSAPLPPLSSGHLRPPDD